MNDSTQSARAQKLASNFMVRTGMSPVDFARRIGYNFNTLQQFLNGHYSAITNSSRISGAILNFIENAPLDLEDAFNKNIYETGAVKVMRGVFAQLLTASQIFMVYAHPGSGKTDVARYLIALHNAQRAPEAGAYIFRVYCRKKISPRDLLKRICTKCGTPADTAIDRAIHNICWDFKGKRVVLYFDEAQNLSIDCLDTVRELFDEEPHFSLIFSGAEDLDQNFSKFTGNLERWERRITDRVTLPPVTTEEATGILRSELPEFTLDQAFIKQQLELATISVRVDKKTQRYISIGRLMATISEIRKSMAPLEAADSREVEKVA
jgi:DNA transposition AAA+ family ATPase